MLLVSSRVTATLAFIVLAAAQSAFAQPKTITQAKAIAGNVTPGDAAGFPVSINQPGSYVFNSNLTVPNENTTAIVINAPHVTINMNGFAILGPTDCTSRNNPCDRAGTGSGIITPAVRVHITIRNGTIEGMGANGILLLGDGHLVEYMHIRSNNESGIAIINSSDKGGSVVQHNTLQRNGDAIFMWSGLVTHNVINTALRYGIDLWQGLASYNSITRCDTGYAGRESGYLGNAFSENVRHALFGVNLGQNVCNVGVCP